MNEPKYDSDSINYGFLKKILSKYNFLEETINNSNKGTITKMYIVPPVPPYYKNTTLLYNNKIYQCIKDRIIGNFDWIDWKVIATNNDELDNFIKNTYDVERIQIQEQLDNKIETYYQKEDPSINWNVDIIKAKHVGDYWYKTSDSTQWIYCKNTNVTPIVYKWEQVNVPTAIFDLINSKKSIYTSKPSNYKKNDMWIIEKDISDSDIPYSEENPIKKGDWVFAIKDNKNYDKSDWIKRDESINIEYLKDNYYSIEEIDSKSKILEENFNSKIDKSNEDILLEVEREYTKEDTFSRTINNYDQKIGEIEEKVIKHSNDISDFKIEADNISSSVSSLNEIISGKDIYILTEDTTYLTDKEYYILNDNNEYILLVEGTDYNVGDSISENIYEKKLIPGLEQEVDSNNTNLNKKLEEVKIKQTSQEVKIDIIATNIDKENGNIKEVTTTNGYKFNSDGMRINSNKDDFNALHNSKGTFYKDSETIIAQFTKDNTITRDLVLYGKYYYGVDENLDVANFTKDDAMFIAEKYTDGNGEEGFGHFYNGGK